MSLSVVAYDSQGEREVIGQRDTLPEAELLLLQCQEGEDKHDRCEYFIEPAL